jgi:hypothetical protein
LSHAADPSELPKPLVYWAEFSMSQREDDLDGAHLRELAAKCRRLAKGTHDTITAAALRQMAAEYDRLAFSREQHTQIPPPRIM